MTKTAGVMRLHDFPYAALAIKSMAEHVDKLFFLAHNAPMWLLQTARKEKKCEIVTKFEGRWNQRVTLAEAFKLVLPYQPDFVIYHDEDEILPDRFPEEFKKFVASERASMGFRYFHTWGDPDTIVADNSYRLGEHCMTLRWHDKIDFRTYAGWCWPSEFYRQKKYHSPYPIRHLAYMTEGLRDARTKRTTRTSCGENDWWHRDHPTIPYDPDMDWKQYVAQAKPCK